MKSETRRHAPCTPPTRSARLAKRKPKADSLDLLLHMFDGLDKEKADEITRIMLDRRRFFARHFYYAAISLGAIVR